MRDGPMTRASMRGSDPDGSVDEEFLGLLVCPTCHGSLALPDTPASVVCERGHGFQVIGGVPRLLEGAGSHDAASISATFGHQWSQFDYDKDRTWGSTEAERLQHFLEETGKPRQWFVDKVVADAGCGNGVLSHAISTLGCRVVATDVSRSVLAARARFPERQLFFVQADLMRSALRPRAFDLIYCGGVLHHTQSTRASLSQLIEALAPGGTIYLWLYWRVPGLRSRMKLELRRLVAPLPTRLKHALVLPVAMQGFIRDWAGARRRTWREHVLTQLDFFTPRYRWEHTPEEVHGWLREMGLSDIETPIEDRDGFGVRARRPG
jgi:SAM-dependent methyltransferase/uncharacterized protein YbaR (Trm112 family)